jgi:hypothetical protein
MADHGSAFRGIDAEGAEENERARRKSDTECGKVEICAY